MGIENYKSNGWKDKSKFNKKWNKICNPKHEHKGHGQKHKMWKTNAKSNIYHLNLHEDMNKKGTRQGYGARSYIRLVLNRLKVMRGLTSIYTHGGT